MESEGLKVGLQFCLCCAATLSIAMAWRGSRLSLWLIEKTESYEDYCWWGEGIFDTFVHWGKASLSHTKCYTGGETRDAVDVYCDGHHEIGTEVGYSMCGTVYAARILTVLGIIFVLLAFLLSVVHDRVSRRVAVFRRRRETAAPPNDPDVFAIANARVLVRKVTIFCIILSLALHGSLLITMINSPMFSNQHFDYLGRKNAVPYDGLGCKFQSPFMNGIVGLLQSHPLKCLYPGLAIPVLISVFVLLVMAVSIGGSPLSFFLHC